MERLRATGRRHEPNAPQGGSGQRAYRHHGYRYGELGDGTTTHRNTPVQISGLQYITALAAGAYHNLAATAGSWTILWHDLSNGNIIYWRMRGTTQVATGTLITAIPNAWRIVAASDYDHDGDTDLIWHNTTTADVVYWTMNGSTLASWNYVAQHVASPWYPATGGDFNGDGHLDIVWQNPTTGQIVYWMMNNTTWTSAWATLATGVPSTWQLRGTPDMNDDGFPDLVWHLPASGEARYWLMNGATKTEEGTFATDLSTQLRLGGAAGFNPADILWHNQTTGTVTYWTMIGVTHTLSGTLPSVSTTWRLEIIY
jgi:hypothetical protein